MYLLFFLKLRLYKVTFFNVMAVFSYKYAVQFHGVKTLIPQVVMTLHLRSAVRCDAKSFNVICDTPFQLQQLKLGIDLLVRSYLFENILCDTVAGIGTHLDRLHQSL